MTVIVGDTRIGVLACDTFVSTGYRATKIFRTKAKGIFGCAGDDTAIAKFEDWLLRRGNKPKLDAEDFTALQLFGGKLYIWGTAMRPELVLSPYHAIGSGGAYALGCLAQGGTVAQALDIAELYAEGVKHPFLTMRERP